MKITSLKVAGFRSMKDVEWHPGDLNIVIGPNASGKSNLLDLFEMLSMLPEGKLGDYMQSRGGIGSVLWDGQAQRIGIALEVVIPSYAGENEGMPLCYSLELTPSGPFGSHKVTSESLLRSDLGRDCIAPAGGAEASPIAKALDEVGRQMFGRKQERKRDESYLAYTDDMLEKPDSIYLSLKMSSWCVNRLLNTSLDSEVRAAPVARYETRIEGDGANLISVLHTLYTENRAFADRIDTAMEAAFDHFDKLVFPPSPVADQRVQMKVRWKHLKRDCPLSELSDGTLRFLYLISILANPDPPSFVAIDEPETGLHPKMMSIVAEYAMDAATRTQLLLTTHSPEFLDAFRDVQPTVTVAELVDGATQLRTLSGESLAYWLNEYTLGDIYRTGQLESMR